MTFLCSAQIAHWDNGADQVVSTTTDSRGEETASSSGEAVSLFADPRWFRVAFRAVQAAGIFDVVPTRCISRQVTPAVTEIAIYT